MTAFGTAYLFIIAAQHQCLKTMTALFTLIFIYGHLKPPASKNYLKNNNRISILSSFIGIQTCWLQKKIDNSVTPASAGMTETRLFRPFSKPSNLNLEQNNKNPYRFVKAANL